MNQNRTFAKDPADATKRVEACPFIGGPWDKVVRGIETDAELVELTRDDGHGSATVWRYERDRTSPHMAFRLRSTRRASGRIVLPGEPEVKETVDVT